MAQQTRQAQAKQQAQEPQGPRPKILRIGVILGGKIVEERLIRDRENVTIGQSAKNTFAVPAAELPKTFTLFQLIGGKYQLNVADSMDGRISDGGQPLALAQMKQTGKATKGAAGWAIPITEAARGKIILGDMTLLFQFVMAPPLQPRPQLPVSVRGSFVDRMLEFYGISDGAMAIVLLLSLIFHGGLGMYIYHMDVPAPPPPDQIPDRFAKAVMGKPAPPKPQAPTPGAGAGDKPADKPTAAGDGSDKQPSHHKPTGQKTGDNAPTNQAAVQERVSHSAVISVLTAKSGNGTGSFLDNTGGKADPNSLEGGLKNVGKDGVALTGSGGLDRGTRTSGTGAIGTGTGTRVGGPIGTIDTGPGKIADLPPAEGRAEKPQNLGGDGQLDADTVLQTIKSRYYPGVVRCYQQQLKANAGLQGKVNVDFTIGVAGNVTKVSVDGFDPAVDACIRQNAKGWRFPKPDGGEAEFIVPFVLKPGH